MTLVRTVSPVPEPVPPLPSDPGEPAEEPGAGAWDIVDDWGVASFPASDPPSNW